MTARSELTALLIPLLPRDWKFVPNNRNIDVTSTPVLRLSQQSIQRHPTSPNSKLLVTFNLQIIAPGTDLARVEDDLDELVGLLLLVLETLPPAVAWSGPADKVLTSQDGGNLAYDVPLTITVNKPTS